MKVKYLIDALSKLDQNLSVIVVDSIDDFTGLDEIKIIKGVPFSWSEHVALIGSWEDYKPEVMRVIKNDAIEPFDPSMGAFYLAVLSLKKRLMRSRTLYRVQSTVQRAIITEY